MKRLVIFQILIVLLIGCKDEQPGVIPVDGSINFNLGSSLTGRTENPSFVSYRLVHENGNNLIGKLDLFTFGDSYVSEALVLTSGSYQLEDYFILNEEEEVMYACPKEGSELAYLVDTPLPISLEINIGDTTTVTPEVLTVDGHLPEDFGYTVFSFEPVGIKELLIQTTVAIKEFYDEVYVPFDYQLTISASNDLSTGDAGWSHTFEMNGLEYGEEVLVRKGYEYYSLTVKKENHRSHSIYLMDTELYGIDRLTFELIPNESNDFLFFDRDGIQIILPRDPCMKYARVDFPEGYQLGYGYFDKSTSDAGGLPMTEFMFRECFGTGPGEWPTSSTFCMSTVNVFDNTPYALSGGYCDAIDYENSNLAENIEDVYFSNYVLFDYFLPGKIPGEDPSEFVDLYHYQQGLEPD